MSVKKKELLRVLKFTLISISAGLIQIGVYSLIRIFTKFPEGSWQDYVIAYTPSLLLSVIWNFTINRKYTFKSANNVKIAMLLVLLFYAIFTPVSTILGGVVVEKGVNADIVFIITLLLNFVLEFLYTRYVVYRNSCDTVTKNGKSIWYVIIRFFVNIFYKKRTFEGLENITEEPVIFVGNHAQIHGPILAEVQFPFKHITWSIGNVFTIKEFIKHAKTDFWGNKPKSIKWLYMILAYIISPIAVGVFNSANVIGVYRDQRIIKTFRETVKHLKKGESIIIFPECHTPYNNIVNEFEENFVEVARLYYMMTKKKLSFVPMYNAVRLKKVLFGKPIEYNPELPSDEIKKQICKYLKEEITKLALSLPSHEVVQYSNEGRRKNPKSK